MYQIKGELDKALDYHQQSLNIDREIGRKEGEASWATSGLFTRTRVNQKRR